MPDKKKVVVHRAQMSAEERRIRSELAQRVSQQALVRGTLLQRKRRCGKPGCRCARGEGHEALLLVVSEKGRTRQLYIPKEWEERVRQWVKDYHDVRQLLEKISRLYRDKVRHRQD